MSQIFLAFCLIFISFTGFSQIDTSEHERTDTTALIINSPAQLKYNQGVEKFNEGNYPDAVKDFTQAINHDSAFVKAYYNRAVAKSEIKDWDGAKADFNTTILLDSANLKIQSFFGQAFIDFKSANYQAAIKSFDIAEKEQFKEAKLYYYRGVAYFQLNNFDEALKNFDLNS